MYGGIKAVKGEHTASAVIGEIWMAPEPYSKTHTANEKGKKTALPH